MNKRSLALMLLVLAGIGVSFVHVSAATLVASPSSGSYTVGQSITVTVRVNSGGQPINAAEGTVSWTPETLQFVSVSSSGSIFKYWPTDPVVRGSSSVIFSGGLPSPGYSGSGGTILKLAFTAKASGTGTVSFSGGRILANDGVGTDVYSGQGTGTYAITSATKPTPAPTTPEVPSRPTPTLSSSTHPNQSAWYRDAGVTLSWSRPTGAKGVSYSLTQDAGTIPDEIVDSTSDSVTQVLASDGTWYMHVRTKYDAGWSSTAHFALHLDRTPPEAFTPTVVQDRGLSDPSPMLTFSTTDAASGIKKYTYRVGDRVAVEASSPTDIAGIGSGKHTVIVTAYDQAGNTREGTVEVTIEGYPSPVITAVPSQLLLLDQLTIKGTANAGDVISIYANAELIGQLIAGAEVTQSESGIVIHVPWTFTTDRMFRPGTISITATATSTQGVTSAPTDAKEIRVNGRSIVVNGRPIASWSVMVPAAVCSISLAIALLGIFIRMVIAVWYMHRREDIVEEELETLRDVNRRQSLNRQQLENAIVQIEDDLDGGKRKRQTTKRRAVKKRTR